MKSTAALAPTLLVVLCGLTSPSTRAQTPTRIVNEIGPFADIPGRSFLMTGPHVKATVTWKEGARGDVFYSSPTHYAPGLTSSWGNDADVMTDYDPGGTGFDTIVIVNSAGVRYNQWDPLTESWIDGTIAGGLTQNALRIRVADCDLDGDQDLALLGSDERTIIRVDRLSGGTFGAPYVLAVATSDVMQIEPIQWTSASASIELAVLQATGAVLYDVNGVWLGSVSTAPWFTRTMAVLPSGNADKVVIATESTHQKLFVHDASGLSYEYDMGATQAAAITTVDYNLDGFEDIAYSTTTDQRLYIDFVGQGPLGFEIQPGLSHDLFIAFDVDLPDAINVGKPLFFDFDGDGDQDLSYVSRMQGLYYVFTNLTLAPSNEAPEEDVIASQQQGGLVVDPTTLVIQIPYSLNAPDADETRFRVWLCEGIDGFIQEVPYAVVSTSLVTGSYQLSIDLSPIYREFLLGDEFLFIEARAVGLDGSGNVDIMYPSTTAVLTGNDDVFEYFHNIPYVESTPMYMNEGSPGGTGGTVPDPNCFPHPPNNPPPEPPPAGGD